jgi:hypothetical protein
MVMADFTITVNHSDGGLTISTPTQKIPRNTTSTVYWVPGSGDLKILFIGFYQPTSQAPSPQTGPITTPRQVSENPQVWASEVDNTYTHNFTDFFYYTVFAEANGVMLSTDPEIQNEAPSGG